VIVRSLPLKKLIIFGEKMSARFHRLTSWIFGSTAARSCFSILTQNSAAQSWSTLARRKTETSFFCAGLWLKEVVAQPRAVEEGGMKM
jgi:hypothetical protein